MEATLCSGTKANGGFRDMKIHRRPSLYLIASLIFAGLVFVAFERSFYLAWFFGTPALSSLLLVHAVVMSGWVLLVVVQAGLVAVHRTPWHRRLGMFGAAWGALVVVLGSVTTLCASAREVRNHTDMETLQLTITGLELVQMALFLCFSASAIWLRARGDSHKRLMLLTIVCMLPSIFPRLPFDIFSSITAILLGVYASLVICVGFDTLMNRRLHPAFACGGALFVASLQFAFFVARGPAWQEFLRQMVS